MNPGKAWWALLTLALMVLSALAGYGYRDWQRDADLPAGILKAKGTVEGPRIEARAARDGTVAEILVAAGADVDAGSLLIRFDDRLSRTELNALLAQRMLLTQELAVKHLRETQLRARQEIAAGEFELADVLHRTQRLSADLFEKRRSELAMAEAALAEIETKRVETEQALAVVDEKIVDAETALDQLLVKAPASGRVIDLSVALGDRIAAGTPLLSIADLDDLFVNVTLPRTDRQQVRAGDEARILLPHLPNRLIRAQVAARDAARGRDAGSDVRLVLESNPDKLVEPGMAARGYIRTQAAQSWPDRLH